MEKSEKTREKLIEQTIALIEENGGDADKVTIRSIAGRAGVSVGLINHYFASKDMLIEACVQTIIGGVIKSFRPEGSQSVSRTERLKRVAREVMDFLMANQQISRISILGDLRDPETMDNTMGTVRGFTRSFSGNTPDESDRVNAFLLTAIMQESFLRKDVLKESLGIDFNEKTARDVYIDSLVDKIFGNGAV